MKKLTLVVFTMLTLVGCGTKPKRKIGEKITKQEAFNKLSKAEDLLYEKEYSSIFNQKVNEKTKVEFEIESKISFDWNFTQEANYETKKDKNNSISVICDDKTYGSSKGTGTDWILDQNSMRSFMVRTNCGSASEFCERFNKEGKYNAYERYGYIEDNKLEVITKNERNSLGSITRTTIEDVEENLQYSSLNKYHANLIYLIQDGFDSENDWFDAYSDGKNLTIKIKENANIFVESENIYQYGLVKNGENKLSRFFNNTYKSNLLSGMYMPKDLTFSIEVDFNEDGSYKTFNSNYSFNARYNNYNFGVFRAVSNAAMPKDILKESFAETKIAFTQTETFTYSEVTITAPSWIEE